LEVNIKRRRNQEHLAGQVARPEILPQNRKNREGTQEKPQKRDRSTLGCREGANRSSLGLIHHRRDSQSGLALPEEGTTENLGHQERPCDFPRLKVAYKISIAPHSRPDPGQLQRVVLLHRVHVPIPLRQQVQSGIFRQGRSVYLNGSFPLNP